MILNGNTLMAMAISEVMKLKNFVMKPIILSPIPPLVFLDVLFLGCLKQIRNF